MAGLKAVIEQKGLFCSLYSDRGSHFFHTRTAGAPPDKALKTQIARALEQLDIRMIPAYSPQARGRCERFFGTWQGRPPQELRLRNINTMEAANDFLRKKWIRCHNSHFTVPAGQTGSAFVPYVGRDLNKIFSYQEERVVGNDNTVSFGKVLLQIQPQTFRFSMAKCRVLVCQHLDETISLFYGPHLLGRYDEQGEALTLGEGVEVGRDVPLNWTTAQKTDMRNYRPGQFLGSHRAVKGIEKNESAEIVRAEYTRVIIRNDRGEERAITAKQAKSFEVYERRTIEVAAGDRLLFAANRREPGFRVTTGHLRRPKMRVLISSREMSGKPERKWENREKWKSMRFTSELPRLSADHLRPKRIRSGLTSTRASHFVSQRRPKKIETRSR
jgi:hypothetical protein